jgi:hypothetical protein
MAVENTDLERRVLAHERVLQVLIAQLASNNPSVLDALRTSFIVETRRGYQHDYVETDDYAEQFMVEVNRLIRRLPQEHAADLKVEATAPASTTNQQETARSSDLIRTELRHGVWRVTRNDTFQGDYLTQQPAVDAAVKLARDIERQGGVALVQFGQ